MRIKTLSIFAIFAVCPLVLAGCNSNNNSEVNLPEDNPEVANTLNESNINVVQWPKTSLTDEELEAIAETNFPKSYTYTSYNVETEQSDSGEYTYPEDLSHTLLIPEHATMASRKVTNSSIEDGMIYTITKVVLQDDTELEVLYINNPETLDFIAANIINGKENRTYQFVY